MNSKSVSYLKSSMFGKIVKIFFVLLCTVCSLSIFGAHGVLADTTVPISVNCGFSSYTCGMDCNVFNDATITIKNGTSVNKARVEVVANEFDDFGHLRIVSPSGVVSHIESTTGPGLNHISNGDISSYFSEDGNYQISIMAHDKVCSSVGAAADLRVTYPTCAGLNSPNCSNGSSSCQTNGRCVDLGSGREGCVYDEVVCNSPGPCQTLPGSCNSDGSCVYATSSESCSADSDPCTYDECVSSDGGKTASCLAGSANLCSGIVPCGRLANDPETPWNDTSKCQVCHIVILLSQIINFLMSMVAILTILAIVIVGLLSITSSMDVQSNVLARQKLSSVLSGFVIIFVAWLVVNTLMILFGFNDPLGNDAWHIFNCDIE